MLRGEGLGLARRRRRRWPRHRRARRGAAGRGRRGGARGATSLSLRASFSGSSPSQYPSPSRSAPRGARPQRRRTPRACPPPPRHRPEYTFVVDPELEGPSLRGSRRPALEACSRSSTWRRPWTMSPTYMTTWSTCRSTRPTTSSRILLSSETITWAFVSVVLGGRSSLSTQRRLRRRERQLAAANQPRRGRVAAAAAWRDRTQTTTTSSGRARRRARRGSGQASGSEPTLSESRLARRLEAPRRSARPRSDCSTVT